MNEGNGSSLSGCDIENGSLRAQADACALSTLDLNALESDCPFLWFRLLRIE